MRALLQRVSRAAVHVDGETVGEVGRGLLILLGVGSQDRPDDVDYVAEKVANLRIFDDDEGKMNLSVLDVGGGALVVSQFTLYADTSRGRRPGFTHAAPPELAQSLYEAFTDALRDLGVSVATGVFGARMHVEIHNDGPVTLVVESPLRDGG